MRYTNACFIHTYLFFEESEDYGMETWFFHQESSWVLVCLNSWAPNVLSQEKQIHDLGYNRGLGRGASTFALP